MSNAPRPNAAFTHSLLLMPNLDAQIMLGIFPGIIMPPDTIRLISKNVIERSEMAGVTSIAANVALSKTADTVLIQYSQLSER